MNQYNLEQSNSAYNKFNPGPGLYGPARDEASAEHQPRKKGRTS